MSARARRLTAWIAFSAMLFGAVSPAIAGILFSGRADVLGRMLAIPPTPVAAEHASPQEAVSGEDDGCPHESADGARPEEPSHSAHHGTSGHESHDDSEHAAHGTFCSFCLTASSVVTLLSPQPAALTVAVDGTDVYVAPERRFGQATPALHRARGPPFPSC